MSHEDFTALRADTTFVNLHTGEQMYRVRGSIHPGMSPRAYKTLLRHVIVNNVHLGGHPFSFKSEKLNQALLDRIHWFRPLRNRYEVVGLVRMVPNTGSNWPGEMVPEIVAVSVDAHKEVYENELCDLSRRLILQ